MSAVDGSRVARANLTQWLWWASQGERWQTRQGWAAMKARWALFRLRTSLRIGVTICSSGGIPGRPIQHLREPRPGGLRHLTGRPAPPDRQPPRRGRRRPGVYSWPAGAGAPIGRDRRGISSISRSRSAAEGPTASRGFCGSSSWAVYGRSGRLLRSLRQAAAREGVFRHGIRTPFSG